MGAGGFVKKAKRTSAVGSKGLSGQHDRCSCHPQAWGLKKGLRRARRRVDKEVIRDEVETTEKSE
jgi:hypothetical protein